MIKKYKIQMIEEHYHEFEVEAETEKEAIEKIQSGVNGDGVSLDKDIKSLCHDIQFTNYYNDFGEIEF